MRNSEISEDDATAVREMHKASEKGVGKWKLWTKDTRLLIVATGSPPKRGDGHSETTINPETKPAPNTQHTHTHVLAAQDMPGRQANVNSSNYKPTRWGDDPCRQ